MALIDPKFIFLDRSSYEETLFNGDYAFIAIKVPAKIADNHNEKINMHCSHQAPTKVKNHRVIKHDKIWNRNYSSHHSAI